MNLPKNIQKIASLVDKKNIRPVLTNLLVTANKIVTTDAQILFEQKNDSGVVTDTYIEPKTFQEVGVQAKGFSFPSYEPIFEQIESCSKNTKVFNRKQLIKILQAIQEDTVKISLTTNEKQAIQINSDTVRALAMPVRK